MMADSERTRGHGRLNGCGMRIGGGGRSGLCGDVGLCSTCWSIDHDQHVPTLVSERDAAEAEVERLRGRAERAETERDRAIETRENANAVSVRVEIENRQLRERAERAETALREARGQLEKFSEKGPKQVGRAITTIDAALTSVPSSLDAPKAHAADCHKTGDS